MNNLVVLELNETNNDTPFSVHPVVLFNQEEMIMIDCGFVGSYELLEQQFINKDLDIHNLTMVIVTHHDHDHIANLARLKEEIPNLKIASSGIEKMYIEGDEVAVRIEQALAGQEDDNANPFIELIKSIETAQVDIVLSDKQFIDSVGGLEIIATPGHLDGHISVYSYEFKTLITGDALVVEDGQLIIANPEYALDLNEAIQSALKFNNYDIEQVVCYHGGIFNGSLTKQLDKFENNK